MSVLEVVLEVLFFTQMLPVSSKHTHIQPAWLPQRFSISSQMKAFSLQTLLARWMPRLKHNTFIYIQFHTKRKTKQTEMYSYVLCFVVNVMLCLYTKHLRKLIWKWVDWMNDRMEEKKKRASSGKLKVCWIREVLCQTDVICLLENRLMWLHPEGPLPYADIYPILPDIPCGPALEYWNTCGGMLVSFIYKQSWKDRGT